MAPCDVDGNVAEDITPTRMWTCADKPADDYYSFTEFAHKLCASQADMREPLPSDSRCERKKEGARFISLPNANAR